MRGTAQLRLKPGTWRDEVYARARAAAPEAFDADRTRYLTGGEWRRTGDPGPHVTPVDGTRHAEGEVALPAGDVLHGGLLPRGVAQHPRQVGPDHPRVRQAQA